MRSISLLILLLSISGCSDRGDPGRAALQRFECGVGQIRETIPEMAVGEYAFLASDFNGYQGIDFAPFKDARLVPILIRCLDAPDTINSTKQGCVIVGKIGEPSGRNVPRQLIPVALAKLGDASAIKPLETVLFHHADINQRMNAAYALAKLLDSHDDRAAIGRKLLEQPDLLACRLSFGKGLIEAGDDAGVCWPCGPRPTRTLPSDPRASSSSSTGVA